MRTLLERFGESQPRRAASIAASLTCPADLIDASNVTRLALCSRDALRLIPPMVIAVPRFTPPAAWEAPAFAALADLAGTAQSIQDAVECLRGLDRTPVNATVPALCAELAAYQKFLLADPERSLAGLGRVFDCRIADDAVSISFGDSCARLRSPPAQR